MKSRTIRLVGLIATLGLILGSGPVSLAQPGPEGGTPAPGIAMHGDPALPANFDHLPYVNPDAPKGGMVALGFQGTFDSLNPFNLKAGSTSQGLIGNVFQSLMMRSADEPFTLYGLIAKSIETNAARSYVTFRLDPHAHFSDGVPITSDDVKFSFELLKTQGRPQQRAAFSQIKSIDTPDLLTVHFDLSGLDDREMPLTLGLMPILPRHATDADHFNDASLAIPIGSGPYVVSEVRPGDRVTLQRDPNYWGKDLPISRGLYNFDQIRIEYFRDSNSMFEAFKAGVLDFRNETEPARWLTGYDFPALQDGRDRKESLAVGGPKGMQGLAFNMRRPMFDDVRVREALGYLFDFEWINANLYGGLYRRTNSFFAESELASTGRPADAAEHALLAPFPGAVRDDIMQGSWSPPVSDGSGRDRAMAAKALALFEAAGYGIKGNDLVNLKTGEPFAFEIMVTDREQERLALLYSQSLKRIGIQASVRTVDDVQYQRRRQSFDFDVMNGSWIASASPGGEQWTRWGSASADQQASFNLAGVKSPAVDALIGDLLSAQSQQQFVDAVRAYDRVLLSGFYILPLFHGSEQWIAYYSKLAHPATFPHYGAPVGSTLETWWRAAP